jgi:hypothetical protein
MHKKSVLLGLNEINFDYIEAYIQKGLLPNFKKLFSKNGYLRTESENEYRLWEPWIQWVTIHTGKTYAQHGVFRLGDIVRAPKLDQLWNVAERKGLKVAAVSPFNARNDLKNPAFFVPDPWTETPASGSPLVKKLSKAVSQAVNDNAQEKISTASAWAMLKGFIGNVPPKKYPAYLRLVSRAKSTKAAKPVFLDRFLADVFIAQWKKSKPDFSSLFLNSGAHIQHHYMFNAGVYQGNQKNPSWYIKDTEDPVLEILSCYDEILGRLMKLNVRLFIATGLHQKPHKHLTYYWRIKQHASFLKQIGVDNYTEVLPRMSRDFLVTFANPEQARNAEAQLAEFYAVKDKEKIFEIDNRGDSLFVELVYPNDIDDAFEISNGKQNIRFKPYIAFVAIKNGEHDGIGYFIDTEKRFEKEQLIPLSQVFEQITSSF